MFLYSSAVANAMYLPPDHCPKNSFILYHTEQETWKNNDIIIQNNIILWNKIKYCGEYFKIDPLK